MASNTNINTNPFNSKNSILLQQELMELLSRLHDLGTNYPNYLVFLSEVVQPNLPPEHRIPVLGKMFEEIPNFLALRTPSSFVQLVQNPPPEAVSFRLLLQFYEVSTLFTNLSVLQLFQMTNNVVPPGPVDYQVQFMARAQYYLSLWSLERVQPFHQVFLNSPIQEEYQKLKELDPTLPSDLLRFFSEILKLPFHEFVSFREWFLRLHSGKLPVLLVLLQQEPVILLEFKRRLTLSTYETQAQHGTTTSSPSPILTPPSPVMSPVHSPHHDPLSPQINVSVTTQYNHNANPSHSHPHPHPQQHPSPNNMHTTPSTHHHNISSPTQQSSPPPNLFSGLGDPTLPELALATPSTSDLSISSLHSPSHHHHPPSPHTNITPSTTTVNTTTPTSRTQNLQLSHSNLTTNSSENLPLLPIPQQIDPAVAPFATIQLKLARQPPSQTVYQRILKPFPTVMVTGFSPGEHSNLFVEVTMLRGDSEAELGSALDGTKVVRVGVEGSGALAPFKKLKIMSTTQQLGTLYRLKFYLKVYVNDQWHLVPSVTVLSEPIEVFSHTLYLSERQEATPRPVVAEILPPSGPPGSRVCILGQNFNMGPGLKVRFHTAEVRCEFHEKGTLICTTPQGLNGPLQVCVSNDGVRWTESSVYFISTP